MDKYLNIAFALFGKYYMDKRSKYFSLRQNLLRSRMNMGYDRYLSGVLLISIIATLCMFLLFIFVIALIGVPVIEANRFGFPAWTAAYRPYQPILVVVFGGLTFAALCFVIASWIAKIAALSCSSSGRIMIFCVAINVPLIGSNFF